MITTSRIDATEAVETAHVEPAVAPDLRDVACRLERVDVRAGGRRALTNVTIDLIEGETTAIVGMPGSGRSTLARVIAGIDEVTCGRMWVEGSPAARLGDHEAVVRRRRGAGIVAAPESIAAPTKPLDLVRANLVIDGVPLLSADRAAREALATFNLVDVAHRRLDRLDRATRMGVAIAAASALQPRLVVADDFGAGQDASDAERQADLAALAQLARSCRERGASAVVVTDDPEVAGAADRVIALDEGAIYSDQMGIGAAGAASLLHELAVFAILRG